MEAPHEFVSFYDEMEDFGCRSQPPLQPRCILPKIECLMQDIPYTTVPIENDDDDDTGSEFDIFGMDLESLRSLWPSYEPSTSEHHYIATDDWFDEDPNLNQTAIENSVIDDNFNINHNQQTLGENSCASAMEEIFDESHVSIKMEPTIEFFSSDEYVNENEHIYGDFANNKLILDNEHEEMDYETKKREQIERNKELMWLLSPIRKQNVCNDDVESYKK
uniref:Uncharacterized protein n=1 Tax=Acrobeloides nanus TaxID=290746 RepID=A0A914CS48_9BILA